MKILTWEARTDKGLTLMELAKKVRNRKIYAQQHRKRKGVTDIIST